MAKLSTFVLHNGKLRRREEVLFPLHDRMVRFADGFFESMRAFATHVPLFALHYQRMMCAFDLLLLNKANFPTEQALLFDIERLIKSNKAFGSSRIRLTVYRSGQGYYFSDKDDIDWFVEVYPLEETKFIIDTKGILVNVFSDVPKPIMPIYSVKVNHATFYILAAQWAKRNGYDDVLLINPKEHIVEATSSNIFVLRKGVLYTPPLTDAPVDGVMRKFLLQHLSAEFGVTVKQESFDEKLLTEADEIFLTNAVVGCKSVLGYGQRRYYRDFAIQLIDWLNKKLKA